jgi:hypothetical protein
MTLDGSRPTPDPGDVQPIPTSFTLKASIVRADPKPAVRIDILTVTGTTVLFGMPEHVIPMLEMALAIAHQAKRALIVPRETLDGPDRPELD